MVRCLCLFSIFAHNSSQADHFHCFLFYSQAVLAANCFLSLLLRQHVTTLTRSRAAVNIKLQQLQTPYHIMTNLMSIINQLSIEHPHTELQKSCFVHNFWADQSSGA